MTKERVDRWDLPTARHSAINDIDELLSELQVHTERSDEYKNPRFIFQDIVKQLEEIRENIKEEIMDDGDLKIWKMSDIAAHIYSQLLLLVSYCEHNNLHDYLPIQSIENHIDYYNSLAGKLDDIARGAM